ncbi:MAG: WD40 repeat domain-containing protein, partial [Gammaproteobacteria bacterium]|nr:WD40 repeat domain-containing protein [Gammaproteobacteria bacterium]
VIRLSANGEALGAVFPNAGFGLWRTDRPELPLLAEDGPGNWYLAFSPSGARVVAGNRREGLQAYRMSDGAPVGPLIEPGLADMEPLVKFDAGESLLVTAGRNDIARYWSVPDVAVAAQEPASGGDGPRWRGAGAAVTAVAPGGARIAFGDRSGHVHIETVGLGPVEMAADGDDISFLGHRAPVTSLAFSGDGRMVASAAADGLVLIWDAQTGSPRPFQGRASVLSAGKLAFSPSGALLAVLGGQRIWLMDTTNGREIASIELGEMHSGIAFATEETIYVGGESGTLRSIYPDRTGNWHLRSVWQGRSSIRHLAVAGGRSQIVIVDAMNEARALDPRDGQVGADVLTLPGAVSEAVFSPNESRVLFRTGRWIHRALMTPTGLVAAETIRAPKAMPGAGMTFDTQNVPGNYLSGDRVLVLTRVTGAAELVELPLNYADGPSLFGSREELLAEWSQRLKGEVPAVTPPATP